MITAAEVTKRRAHFARLNAAPDGSPTPADVRRAIYEDSLEYTYSVAPNCEPIISPTGVRTDVDVNPDSPDDGDGDWYTVPDNPDRPWSPGKTPDPAEFAAYYGVYVPFLPFSHLENDRIEQMKTMTEHLTGRPPTRERISKAYLRSDSVLDDHRHSVPVGDMCLLSGWWPGTALSSNGTHYFNPDYCHNHDRAYCITDSYERMMMAHWAGALYLSDSDLAPIFGVTHRATPKKYIRSRGASWEQLRSAGRRRLARTVKTIRSWGYTWADLSAAFGRPETTLITWVAEWASEFTPPPDPMQQGFERSLMDWVAERRERDTRTYGHFKWANRLAAANGREWDADTATATVMCP